MSLIATINPYSWTKIDILLTYELVSTFAKIAEEQAKEIIEKYKDNVDHFVPEGYEEMEGVVIAGYRGLYDDTWDLESLFVEHFPSFQRRSALLSIVGVFETEINKLCYLYKESRKLNLDLKDLKGMGLNRAKNYLEKVIGLNLNDSQSVWQELNKIQKIRNIIAHRDGSLKDNRGEVERAVIDYINDNKYLSGEHEVIVAEGYLHHVIEVFMSYFQNIGKQIEYEQKA